MNVSNEVRIGIMILIAVLVAYMGFRFMSDAPIFRQANEIVTTFDRVDGLSSGNVVYLHGVKIGSVRNIRLMPDTRVRVTLSIDRHIEVPVGSVAHLTSTGLIDGKAIIVERGDSDENVPHGGEIDGIYVDTMMETLAEKGQELGDDISESFTELNNFLVQLNRTLDDQRSSELQQSIGNAESLTRSLSELMESRQQDLDQAIQSANRTMQQLDTLTTDNRPRVDSLMVSLEETVRELKAASQDLDVTVDQLNQILVKINEGEGSLGRMVNDPSLYNHSDSLAVEMHRLIRDLNENPGRFLRHVRLIDLF
ncbi:MAG: MlaD family protein [Balneolaceae bacterium]